MLPQLSFTSTVKICSPSFKSPILKVFACSSVLKEKSDLEYTVSPLSLMATEYKPLWQSAALISIKASPSAAPNHMRPLLSGCAWLRTPPKSMVGASFSMIKSSPFNTPHSGMSTAAASKLSPTLSSTRMRMAAVISSGCTAKTYSFASLL